MINSQTQSISIDGFKLNYTIVGEGPTIMVIGSHLYYPRTFSPELYKQFQFVFLDHRGFAETLRPYSPPDFSLHNLINDIETVRKHLKIDRMLLLGHSGHGYIALEYAKKFPDSLSHLILIALSPEAGEKNITAANRYFEESVCPERKMLLQENLKKLESILQAKPEHAFISRMLAFGPMIWYKPDFDASFLWSGVKLIPEMFDEVWGKIFPSLAANNLEAITCPIFLGLGRYDYWNPPYLWETFRPHFNNLTLCVFEKSGHTPQYEEPTLFNEVLCDWIAGFIL